MSIVIDTGSAYTKAALDSGTPVSFRTVVGRPRQGVAGTAEVYVGDAAWARRSILQIGHPVSHGVVIHSADAACVWQHAIKDQLGQQPADQPVLLIESIHTPRQGREEATKLMFDTVGVKALSMTNSATLALASTGRSTGLVADIGAELVTVASIHNGQALPGTIALTTAFAGTELTNYLVRLLIESGHSFTTAAEQDIVRDIKEKTCYVAASPDPSPSAKAYTLPDGQQLAVYDAAWQCPEAMFDPGRMGIEAPGLPAIINERVSAAPAALTAQLLANIVLTGGSAQFPGLTARLTSELKKLRPNATITVTVAPDPTFAVIRSGSLRLKDPATGWVTKADYDKHGPAIIHQTCPTPTP